MNAVTPRRIVSPYSPRVDQLSLHKQLKRFNSLVCHRRFGKTVLAVNQLVGSALKCEKTTNPERAGAFAYVAPLLKQAKRVSWNFLLHYSEPFRLDYNISELTVMLKNYATISLYGADNPDAIRGGGWTGAVLDEYADMQPTTWTQVVRPLLADRKGWAIFIGTPKGQNHFYDLHEQAKTNPEWFAKILRASETGIVPPEELISMQSVMDPAEYAQELECSFASPNAGSYYGKQLDDIEKEGKIGTVSWNPAVQVSTAWDLGMDDATAIWFYQQVGTEVHIIDYYENSGEGLAHYVAEIKSRPYAYADHLLPHDAQVKELGTGKSRVEVLQELGINPTVVPMQRVEDGINAVRMLLPRCWFDATKCARGIKALRGYCREWADKLGTWRARPRHDWASHSADAFRYLALGLPSNTKSEDLVYPELGIV